MSKWTRRAWPIYLRLRANLDDPHRQDVKDLYDLLLNELADVQQELDRLTEWEWAVKAAAQEALALQEDEEGAEKP